MLHKCYIILIGFSLSLFTQCKKEEVINYSEGEVNIAVDPSLKNVATALTDIYQSQYPKVKINLKYVVEDLAIQQLYKAEVAIAIVGRKLNEKEQTHLKNQTNVNYQATQIGCDAAIFIVKTDSPIKNLSQDYIKNTVFSDSSKFVFDSGNSSNFNTLTKHLNLTIPKDKGIQALEGTEKVIDYVSKNAQAIGIIGFNTLSDELDPKVRAYLKHVRILPILDKENKEISASPQTLRTYTYPFTKGIYILNNEPTFGIGSGLSRFSGSQQGQLIVLKEGLQPYYLYPREVQLNSKPLQ